MAKEFTHCNECTGSLATTCKRHGCLDATVKLAPADVPFTLTATVTKVDEERRVVYGWASVIEEDGKPVVDLQGDVITEADLVTAAEGFMLDSREAGDGHVRTSGIGKAVASIVMTKELQAALGIDLKKVGWLIGFKVEDDATWAMVKSGEYAMFSIGGMGRREPMA